MGIIIPTDELIFFKRVKTTNQNGYVEFINQKLEMETIFVDPTRKPVTGQDEGDVDSWRRKRRRTVGCVRKRELLGNCLLLQLCNTHLISYIYILLILCFIDVFVILISWMMTSPLLLYHYYVLLSSLVIMTIRNTRTTLFHGARPKISGFAAKTNGG